MKNTIHEPIGLNHNPGERIYFSEVKDSTGHPWFAVVLMNGRRPVFKIHNSYGKEVGFIFKDGELHMHVATYSLGTHRKFKHTTRAGLLQAVRFAYLKHQQPKK